MRRGVLAPVFLFVMVGAGLRADSLVLGDPPILGTGFCDPFGCPGFDGLGTYQQVYVSSAFPGSISIDALTFYAGQVLGGTPAGGTYTVSLSYTPFGPGGLSLASPGANIGADSEVFFSGSLPPLTPEGIHDELILDGTPFTYDPADGNLLMTVSVTGGMDPDTKLYLNEAACGPQTACPAGSMVVSSDVYFGSSTQGNIEGGLVTGFDYTTGVATPEPASVLLVIAGLGAVACARRRRTLPRAR
ncbi:MAG: PEP-CTERM sorting domain-containing protein [Bryobacteraceae bacterium]